MEHVFVDEESSWIIIGRVDVVIVVAIGGDGDGSGVVVGGGGCSIVLIIRCGREVDTTDKRSSGGGEGRMVFEIETG